MPDSMSIPDISVLQSLPYLNAFIKEGENACCCYRHRADVTRKGSVSMVRPPACSSASFPPCPRRLVSSSPSTSWALRFPRAPLCQPRYVEVSSLHLLSSDSIAVLEPQPRRHRLPFSGDIPARPLAGRGHQLDVGSPSSFRLRHQSLRWPEPCANHAQDRRRLHRQEL